MAEVELQKVSKRFGKTEIIKNVDLKIPHDQLTVFVGPSGCGKSTLLRLIAGLETPTYGEILIDQQKVNDVHPADRGIGMVFQSYALYPHMTVYNNMAFGLKNRKMSKDEIQRRIDKAAKMLSIQEHLDRKPRNLSGGQRQRVAIGRALVKQPEVFLLDEPLSNLDAALRDRMRVEIAKLRKSLGATMVYVTHDQLEAMTLADQIVVLKEGVVEQVGAPMELYEKPVNRFVAGFIGSPRMNFIPAEIQKVSGSNVEVKIEDSSFEISCPNSQNQKIESGQKVEVGIRPEHLKVERKGSYRLQGEVEVSENLGDHRLIYFELKDQSKVMSKSRTERSFQSGESITVEFESDDCHLFNSDGISLSH